MKLLFIQLAALSSAFVLPNEQVSYLRHVEVESPKSWNSLPSKSEILNDLENSFDHLSQDVEHAFEDISEEVTDTLNEYTTKSRNAIDDTFDTAFAYVEDRASQVQESVESAYHETHDWMASAMEGLDNLNTDDVLDTDGHHHHGGHHKHKPNMTVYQLIAGYKYTKTLTKLINEYDDLVEALNGTAANYTVFAPLDSAFEKIPKDHKPSKKVLKAILSYHVSPEFYPASRILVSRTIPSLLKSDSLGKDPLPQRLSTNIGLHGLTVNFLSRVVAVNIYGTNGVIHGVDNLILPPPPAMKIVELTPGDLSTLELGLLKTGLFEAFNTTENTGGTLFAPTNSAFSSLGHRADAFLFSEYGLKYLKALLEYHVVPNNTLYSDAYYKASSNEITSIPKGAFHVDLPTLLEDRSLSIDIARFGRLIEIKINAFARVATSDIVAENGVIHFMDNVLIPPKKLANGETDAWAGSSEITVEELKERLEPYIKQESYPEEL